MKKLKKNYKRFTKLIFSFFIIFILIKNAHTTEIIVEIYGNTFTDNEVILSLLDDQPNEVSQEYSNYIIKNLVNSDLFENVKVEIINNKYLITVKEFSNINKIIFKNNERLKDEELNEIANQLNLINLNPNSINSFVNEIEKIYQSFGYNNLNLKYFIEKNDIENTANIIFQFEEGKITKINRIYFKGNNTFDNEELKSIISSKTRNLRNIFANNNFKRFLIEKDKFTIINYYKNNGYINIKIDYKIEYLKSNKVNIYFNINEGELYLIDSVKVLDKSNILNKTLLENINAKANSFESNIPPFSLEKINNFKREISNLIIDDGNNFFEINTLQKIDDNNISILFEILTVKPKYTNQINIIGNTRTYDYVIRRELEIVEGDAVYDNQIDQIKNKLNSLNLFKSVKVDKEIIDENKINLNIEVEEKQTGTFNAGVSVGTLDGFSVITGLKERNFYGTGRSLEVLLNTSEDRNEFKLISSDRFSLIRDSNISYKINYKQQDLSKSSSYKLDTFTSGVGVGYKINKNLFHNIDLAYALKDYTITNSSTVASSIASSSGENVSFLLENNFRYSTLNNNFITKYGDYINYNNTIETPTSSSNGFMRNIFVYKKFINSNKNIYSAQTKLGNIISLNNNDILIDDKFSLGGRWLRGFDNFGVGPRNSRTSYVGGNNLAAAKFDYSREIFNNANFPIYFNIFNDYGLLWENKTKPTNSDNTIRSSYGFGIKYYSPIGPIGFTWGFPLIDEEYDIKRMFLFSIGNID